MFERRHEPLLYTSACRMRLIRNGAIVAVLVAVSLGIGMSGYHGVEV